MILISEGYNFSLWNRYLVVSYQPGIDRFLKSAAKVGKNSVYRKKAIPENAYFNKYLSRFADFCPVLSGL